MKKIRLYVGVAVLLVLIIIGLSFFGAHDFAPFASCLADKGYVMYGTSWCPHCQEQKAMFKGAFEDILMLQGSYVDCDQTPQPCADNDIRGYPTWITPEGFHMEGTQPLSALSQQSGCTLP